MPETRCHYFTILIKKGFNMIFNTKLLYTALLAATLAAQLSACVPVIIGGAAAGGAMAADRRTSGIYVEDENIELKASKQIADTLGEAAHVNITSYNRIVLLTGEVPNDAGKVKAEAIAKAITNVRSVTNELVVMPKTEVSSRGNDAYLTSKIKAKFVADGRFPANVVKVVTENSVVYLLGIVSHAEAQFATEIASNADGVTKVVKVFEYNN